MFPVSGDLVLNQLYLLRRLIVIVIWICWWSQR